MNYRVVLSRTVRTKNFDKIYSTKTVEMSGRNSYDVCAKAVNEEIKPGWKVAHLFEESSEKWLKIF